jgi:hypothetical protein
MMLAPPALLQMGSTRNLCTDAATRECKMHEQIILTIGIVWVSFGHAILATALWALGCM